MRDSGEKLTYGVIGFVLILGVIGMIGLWYLALFALALIIFLVIVITARKQRKTTQDVLQFRPGMLIPAEVWQRAEGLEPAVGPETLDVSFVELDKYASNWATFRDIAQIDRAGSVDVFGYFIAYKTPTADRGVVLAYDRLILGEIREIELEHFFDPIWSAGGIMKVACRFSFDGALKVSGAVANLPIFLPEPGSILPAREQFAWNAIWRGVRGKPVE